MVKHTQTISRQFAVSLFDPFVGLALKGLKTAFSSSITCTILSNQGSGLPVAHIWTWFVQMKDTTFCPFESFEQGNYID